MPDEKHFLDEIAEACGGKIDSVMLLPDGSGGATMSIPLKPTHWLYNGGNQDAGEPPAPFRMGHNDMASVLIQRKDSDRFLQCDPPIRMRKSEFEQTIRAAAVYAIRASTMCGKDEDFDPDAMVQNFINGLLGYNTHDGSSHL